MLRLITTPSGRRPVAITLFQVVGGGKSLRQLEGSMRRRPLTYTVDRPDGGTVELKTSAGNFKTGGGDDNLHASITEEYLDEYTAPGGARQSVVKARTIDIVFTADGGHLLVFAGRQGAGPIASKVSDIAFNAKDSPVLSCSILPPKIDAFIKDHGAQILSCSWGELRIPSLSRASLNGIEIGANPDFQRFDRHGSKNSVRVRLPSMGMTLSINREASVHFYTSHERRDEISFIMRHIVPLCR